MLYYLWKDLIVLNKNYYDILEINKNASPEIVEKAYKTLVKKYHPDLQVNNKKFEYEEKIKEINEAYMILSNKKTKDKYDSNLKNNEISDLDYNNLCAENINLKKEINYLKNKQNLNNTNTIREPQKNNSNSNFLMYFLKFFKNIFSKKNQKKKLKDILALILTAIIFVIISFILWHIPFTKNYLINLYNQNDTLKLIIDTFINIFN